MRFKKVLCMTTLATLLFPVVQNIEYVDAAEYSIDIVVDTVEIDINDIPEDRCVKVGISLYNSPGINGIFFPLEKDERLEFFDFPPIEYSDMGLSLSNLTDNIKEISLYYGSLKDNLIYDECFCYIKLRLPENISIGDFFSVNILNEYIYKSYEESNGTAFNLSFCDKDFNSYSYDNFNITNGGIRIVGADSPQTEPSQTEPPQTEPPQTEPPQTEPPQTEPPQTEPPQTEPPQTELPQTSTSQTTSTTIESTTTTTTAITTTTNELTVTTTGNTTISTTSVTTTSSASSVTTTTISETSEVTENKNDKSKNNLPLILAVLASIGILGGIIGFIIKKSKGNKGK